MVPLLRKAALFCSGGLILNFTPLNLSAACSADDEELDGAEGEGEETEEAQEVGEPGKRTASSEASARPSKVSRPN
ncbi:hypothetical protein cyc_04178 [Cyclospora cayetanensis]|uniref:Uncharacterized protein n=1 Tax=Cyclospora cayetanensis TaxID=88456 RepID=A0A1D3D5C3_9EIME|nr:hypothetical protein cyc_04178 [Cyclospora cayetanensis]